MQIKLGPQNNVGEKPTVILYIYINCLPNPLLVYGSMLLLSTLVLSSYSIIMVMLWYDWGLRMVINITCLKYQEVVLYLQPLNTLA